MSTTSIALGRKARRLLVLFVLAVLVGSGDPPQAAEATPSPGPECDDGRVPWNGRCLYPAEWDVDDVRCPNGVVLLPYGEEHHRCVPCAEVMDMMFQQPMNWCAGQEAKHAISETEREYQELLDAFPSRGPELRKTQVDWLKKRDAECGDVLAEYEGGSMGPLAYATCRTSWAEARTKALRELRRLWQTSGLERFAIRLEDRGPLGWLFVVAQAASTIAVGAWVGTGMLRKWRDPEWRRVADKWTWMGMTLGAAVVFGILSFVLFISVATTVVWLRR